MFKKILVPLDGSHFAENALEYAEDLARKYGAEIILVRACFAPVAILGPGDMATMPAPANYEEDAAREYLAKMRDRVAQHGVSCETVALVGDPSEGVIEMSAEKGADLIVVTSHGRSGFKRFLMGSVAERIARHAPCPVLIIGRDTLERRHS
jgi:nucleotide-binding universal stress UspA family protein